MADHITIGSGAVLGAGCGVEKDVPARVRVLGAPARPDRDAKRFMAAVERLVQQLAKQLQLA